MYKLLLRILLLAAVDYFAPAPAVPIESELYQNWQENHQSAVEFFFGEDTILPTIARALGYSITPGPDDLVEGLRDQLGMISGDDSELLTADDIGVINEAYKLIKMKRGIGL